MERCGRGRGRTTPHQHGDTRSFIETTGERRPPPLPSRKRGSPGHSTLFVLILKAARGAQPAAGPARHGHYTTTDPQDSAAPGGCPGLAGLGGGGTGLGQPRSPRSATGAPRRPRCCRQHDHETRTDTPPPDRPPAPLLLWWAGVRWGALPWAPTPAGGVWGGLAAPRSQQDQAGVPQLPVDVQELLGGRGRALSPVPAQGRLVPEGLRLLQQHLREWGGG